MIHLADYSFNSSVIHKPQRVSKALILPGLGVEFPSRLIGQSVAVTLPGWKGSVPTTSAPAAERHFGAKQPPNGSYKLIVLCQPANPHQHWDFPLVVFFSFFQPGLFSRSFRSLLAVTEATSVLCRGWWLLFVSRWPDVCDQRRSPKQSCCCLLVCCSAG